MPEKPEPLSLQQAATRTNAGENLWVTLDKVKWDCQNMAVSQTLNSVRTDILFTDDSGSVLGDAQFSDKQICSELPASNVSGKLYQMYDSTYNLLPKKGFNLDAYKGATARMELCTFCGRSNSMLGVYFCMAMIVFGLSMYPMFWLRNHNQTKKAFYRQPVIAR